MVGMKNGIIHDYGNFDYIILWNVIRFEIPKLNG